MIDCLYPGVACLTFAMLDSEGGGGNFPHEMILHSVFVSEGGGRIHNGCPVRQAGKVLYMTKGKLEKFKSKTIGLKKISEDIRYKVVSSSCNSFFLSYALFFSFSIDLLPWGCHLQ